ncbi:TPA: hypothetical protein LOL70_004927 [Salmonella enterica subsp. enterica serovar Infantis]|nr:hypothetical protein [Salmonella enterica subsp. enterica serovar Infantis]
MNFECPKSASGVGLIPGSALSVVVNAQADALETAPLDEDSAISGE